MTDWVVDASALLAVLNREPGADRVAEALAGEASMSAVNLAEVVTKLADVDMPAAEIREALDPLGVTIVDFDADSAHLVGALRPATRQAGLSLGDRACLALAERLGVPALTADRSWGRLGLDTAVTTIR